MYLERAPMAAPAAERLPTEGRSKLLLVKTGPYCAIGVSPATVRIDEDDIRNTVSLDWTTVALAAKETATQKNRTQIDENKAEREESHTGDKPLAEGNVAKAPREYPVDRIGCHVAKGNNVNYVLSLYGYTAAGEKVEPYAPIPESFIT